ncbi:hypothetical protein UlMin_039979 [Ulmus minor]
MRNDESLRVVEDVEEGEISDSASVEEISEADFKQDAAKVSNGLPESKPKGSESRVWTMRDLCQYPGFRGYATGLYNIAWAQAVQNKSLDEIFVRDVDPKEKSNLSSSLTPVNTGRDEKSNVKEVVKVVIDDSSDEMDADEKEEGELEEGEIDLDSEPEQEPKVTLEAKEDSLMVDTMNVDDLEIDSKDKELEKRVNSLREALESISLTDAEKSFEEVCSQLLNSLASLKGVLSVNNLPTKDDLMKRSLAALRVVNSAFGPMNQTRKEEKKDILLRLLCFVRNSNPPFFSSELMKEVDAMISSLNRVDVLPAIHKQKEMQETKESDDSNVNAVIVNSEFTSAKLPSHSIAVSSGVHGNQFRSSDVLRPGTSGFKGRGVLLPLLDLHKDHDLDSLPSPTREAPSCFPVNKPLAAGDGMVKSGVATAKTGLGTEDSKLRPYETDAFKAVSSYQQKFGRSSFSMTDRLPSPTPSEEGDVWSDDTNNEVMSSFNGGNLRTASTPTLGQSVVCSIPTSSSSMQVPIPAKATATMVSSSNPTMKASAKSRDPRLRFANTDFGNLDLNQRPLSAVQNAPKVESSEPISSRKQRTIEELNLDGPALKRQRNALESTVAVSDVKTVSGVGGWLEDSSTSVPQLMKKTLFMENAEADLRNPVNMATYPTNNVPNFLPGLLKDIAVNPTMLQNILKLGQLQRFGTEAQQNADPTKNTVHPPSTSSLLGSASLVNIAASKVSGISQTPAGTLPVSSQVTPMSPQDELGKIRMKPRDPRRVLHGNSLQKSGSLGHEQFKNIVLPILSNPGSKDNGQTEQGQADKKPMPDITRQFTKNLRNIADIMSVSQASTSPALVSQNLSSQPVPIKLDRGDVKAVVSNIKEQQNSSTSPPEAVAAAAVAGPSRSPNAWGDVEHLFEGYDDQQKAAIQRERARRLEEQKKMFKERKLCLVLDLDHTLLNSAKFVEVEPMHDEILRRKEEQDREKPQRHLFRFPHMGMWTKLRPGVWNFLEKASKLFEMHLYTMGNKLYATEMAKVLDPKGVLFAGRVISRGDEGGSLDSDERAPKSKDLEGVLGMESAVVIIDDSVRVWPHNKLNLIVVERYTYFPCSRRQFGLPGPSLLEIDHDERTEDGTLASSLAVIEKIHQNFFSHHSLDEADVRNILATEQRKILAGCRIVFSRVYPVGEVNPHLHPLWQTAEQFGAVCTTELDDQVTHVVANGGGTDKVNWALSTGRFVVYPGWVEASALLYRRANEQDFALKPQQP